MNVNHLNQISVIEETVPLTKEALPFPAPWRTQEILDGILGGHLKIEPARKLKNGALKAYGIKVKGKLLTLPHLIPLDKIGLSLMIPNKSGLYRSASEFVARRMGMALRGSDSKPKKKLAKTALVTARRLFGAVNPTKAQVDAVLASLTRLAQAEKVAA